MLRKREERERKHGWECTLRWYAMFLATQAVCCKALLEGEYNNKTQHNTTQENRREHGSKKKLSLSYSLSLSPSFVCRVSWNKPLVCFLCKRVIFNLVAEFWPFLIYGFFEGTQQRFEIWRQLNPPSLPSSAEFSLASKIPIPPPAINAFNLHHLVKLLEHWKTK